MQTKKRRTLGSTSLCSPIGKATLEVTRDVLKKRLNSRCMGLLEITEHSAEFESMFVDASRSIVEYLRRTVPDYLANAGVQEKLNLRANRALHQNFDRHLRLCSAQLAFYKCSHMRITPDAGHTPTFPDMSDTVCSHISFPVSLPPPCC